MTPKKVEYFEEVLVLPQFGSLTTFIQIDPETKCCKFRLSFVSGLARAASSPGSAAATPAQQTMDVLEGENVLLECRFVLYLVILTYS